MYPKGRMEKIPGGKEPTESDITAVLRIIKKERTDQFSETEMRLMIACFRKGGESVRALLKEFDNALDKRIKAKLGLAEAPQTERDPVE